MASVRTEIQLPFGSVAFWLYLSIDSIKANETDIPIKYELSLNVQLNYKVNVKLLSM